MLLQGALWHPSRVLFLIAHEPQRLSQIQDGPLSGYLVESRRDSVLQPGVDSAPESTPGKGPLINFNAESVAPSEPSIQ